MPDAVDYNCSQDEYFYLQQRSTHDPKENHEEPGRMSGPPLYEDEDLCLTGGQLGLLSGR